MEGIMMDFDKILSETQAISRNFNNALKLLKELKKTSLSNISDAEKIKKKIAKLENLVLHAEDLKNYNTSLISWLKNYNEAHETQLNKEVQVFGNNLDKKLKDIGMSLSGKYPLLQVGLFSIEVDFKCGKARIWYGPQKELLRTCPLSEDKIVGHLHKLPTEIGSKVDTHAFLQFLKKACHRYICDGGKEPIPIVRILREIAYLVQSPKFLNNPKQEDYRSYSRADFSYDLYKLNKSEHATEFNKEHKLIVAIRSLTRKKEDFLWIPDDDTGHGSTYSHITFQGEHDE